MTQPWGRGLCNRRRPGVGSESARPRRPAGHDGGPTARPRCPDRRPDAQGQIGQHRLPRFLPGRLPQGRRHGRPGLGREAPRQARRHVAADQRRLDRDRARAAERIDQRPVRLPEAQQHQGGGQGFLERRLADQSAIAAFVQSRAAGVDGQGGLVFQQGDFHRILGPRLGKPLHAVGRLEALHDGLLDDLLTRRHAGELRLDRAAADREGGVGRQPLGQGSARVRSKSWPKSTASKLSSRSSTRSAVRSHKFARQMSAGWPRKRIRPIAESWARSRGPAASWATTASRPKVEVAIRSSGPVRRSPEGAGIVDMTAAWEGFGPGPGPADTGRGGDSSPAYAVRGPLSMARGTGPFFGQAASRWLTSCGPKTWTAYPLGSARGTVPFSRRKSRLPEWRPSRRENRDSPHERPDQPPAGAA